MSLSSRTMNTLRDKINISFAEIGVSNGTKMPKSGDNREPIAWELWVAHHLASYADKRKRVAEAAAIKAGVIFDKEKDPKPAGTDAVIYNGEVVSISVLVRQPTTRVDVDKLMAVLKARGVKQKILDEGVEQATVTNRPAHVFNAKLIQD